MLLPKTKKIAKLGIRRLGLCSCCVPMSYLPNLSESESVSLSVVSDSLWPHSLSMEFFRQEYWSGLPFPSPGDLPDSGIKPGSLALQGDFFTIWATRGEHFSICAMETVILTSQTTGAGVITKWNGLIESILQAVRGFRSAVSFQSMGPRTKP